MSSFRHSLAFAVLLCVTTGCGGPSTNDQVTIAVGGRSTFDYAPVTLAETLGHYRSENLDARLIDMSGGSKALEALLGGSADLVCGYFDHTIQMAAEGRDLRAFVVLANRLAVAILVSPKASKSIERIEDLRGASIGVSAQGSSTHFFLSYVLLRHGIEPGNYSVVATGGGASRLAALEHGKVDAGVQTEPWVTFMTRRNGELKLLADTRTREGSKRVLDTEEYPTAVLYTTAKWLADHPEKARRLARTMTKTLDWISHHSAEEFAAAMPANIKPDDPAGYVEAISGLKDAFSVDGTMSLEGAQAAARVMRAVNAKVRTADIDLSKTYTNEFVLPEADSK